MYVANHKHKQNPKPYSLLDIVDIGKQKTYMYSGLDRIYQYYCNIIGSRAVPNVMLIIHMFDSHQGRTYRTFLIPYICMSVYDMIYDLCEETGIWVGYNSSAHRSAHRSAHGVDIATFKKRIVLIICRLLSHCKCDQITVDCA